MEDNVLKDVLQWQYPLWQTPLEYWENKISAASIQNPIALEIGAREGGLSLWLALKGFQVVCSDIRNPVLTASPLHRKYKVHSLIRYEAIDATNISYKGYFDIIVLKSVIGGIGAYNRKDLQIQSFRQIHQALKPGGYFLFAENAQASVIHRIFRKLKSWSYYWNYPEYGFLKRELADIFSIVDMKAFGYFSAFITSSIFQKTAVCVDKKIDHFLSSKNKHIVYGIAQK